MFVKFYMIKMNDHKYGTGMLPVMIEVDKSGKPKRCHDGTVRICEPYWQEDGIGYRCSFLMAKGAVRGKAHIAQTQAEMLCKSWDEHRDLFGEMIERFRGNDYADVPYQECLGDGMRDDDFKVQAALVKDGDVIRAYTYGPGIEDRVLVTGKVARKVWYGKRDVSFIFENGTETIVYGKNIYIARKGGVK